MGIEQGVSDDIEDFLDQLIMTQPEPTSVEEVPESLSNEEGPRNRRPLESLPDAL